MSPLQALQAAIISQYTTLARIQKTASQTKALQDTDKVSAPSRLEKRDPSAIGKAQLIATA